MVNRKTKKGKSARNAQSGLGGSGEPEDIVKAPHSFVINRGKLGKNVNELMLNFRKIMEPFTATQLRVLKQNTMKDFIHMAGPLNVTHLVVFTKTKQAIYLHLAKLPRGPTMTYQVKEYSLIRDVIQSQKKPLMYEKLFEHHPLLVLNNFSGEGMHFKLMATMFQNMFPSINVNKTSLNRIRRCLLMHYNDDKTIDMRQYAIKIVPTGLSKAVKKLIQSKVPNLGQYQNVDEFLQKTGNLSESEVEMDSAANTVVLPQPISSRGNMESEKSAIRLYEIGPRLKLQLVKIEEGLLTGEVMYHEYIKRTPEEIKALKEKIKANKLLKVSRRAEQKRNVERKLAATKEKSGSASEVEEESDDDRRYYREEVGEEPDENILAGMTKKRKIVHDNSKFAKKKKVDHDVSKKKKSSNDMSDKGKTSKVSKGKRSSSMSKKGKTSNDKSKKGKASNDKSKDSSEMSPKGTKTFQEFLTRRKRRKEAKTAKRKTKKIPLKVLNLRAKQTTTKKSKKKSSK